MKILIADDEQIALDEMLCVVKKVKPEAEIICADNYQRVLQEAENGDIDVAFLDVEMPEMNGIELAKQLKDRCPNVNIVFVTAYAKYAVEAFGLYASGYILKPIQQEDVEEALKHLRNPVVYHGEKLKVQCFGNFEVFYQNQPVQFRRSRAKELLAYLIDLRGAAANTEQLCAVLWEDSVEAEKNHHYFRNLVSELKKVLKECNARDVFVCKRNSFAIDVTQVECDYYKFLDHNVAAINSYRGEYMKQYSWAEMTTGVL